MPSHASPSDARNYLDFAKTAGYIHDFEQIDNTGRILWKIETIPTRYNTYHALMDSEAIVLTTKEVHAFIEGVWAGAKIHPIKRAGDRLGPVRRHMDAQREKR